MIFCFLCFRELLSKCFPFDRAAKVMIFLLPPNFILNILKFYSSLYISLVLSSHILLPLLKPPLHSSIYSAFLALAECKGANFLLTRQVLKKTILPFLPNCLI
jgi:hypothetical protein